MNLVIPCHSNNYCTCLHIATAARSIMKLLIHATSKIASVFSVELTIAVKISKANHGWEAENL